jgi:hypothetical protein
MGRLLGVLVGLVVTLVALRWWASVRHRRLRDLLVAENADWAALCRVLDGGHVSNTRPADPRGGARATLLLLHGRPQYRPDSWEHRHGDRLLSCPVEAVTCSERTSSTRHHRAGLPTGTTPGPARQPDPGPVPRGRAATRLPVRGEVAHPCHRLSGRPTTDLAGAPRGRAGDARTGAGVRPSTAITARPRCIVAGQHGNRPSEGGLFERFVRPLPRSPRQVIFEWVSPQVRGLIIAEGEGFEPPETCASAVFKTAA